MKLVFQYFFQHSNNDFLYIELVGKIHLNRIVVLIIRSWLDLSVDVSGKNDCSIFYPSLSCIHHMVEMLNQKIKLRNVHKMIDFRLKSTFLNGDLQLITDDNSWP